jgi:hypothetical protein
MTFNLGLFQRLMGDDWEHLSTSVKRMHGDADRLVAQGVADVEGSQHWIARLLREQLGLPKPGRQQRVEVTIERSGTHEIWTRRFASQCMRSTLRRTTHAPLLAEKLGLITLRFALNLDHESIDWQLQSARWVCLPIPRFLFGKVMARCASENGRYTFQIDTRLPLIGRLVAYRGWLEIVDERR